MKRIVFQNGTGGISIMVPALDCGLTLEQVALKDVPVGVPYEIVDASEIPADRTFRSAWEMGSEGMESVVIHVGKAKDICHCRRRAARGAEFAPLDIRATIPGEAEAAEVAREVIRQKYAVMQVRIDQAECVEELLAIWVEMCDGTQ